MGINRVSGAGEASFLLQYARSKKYKALSFARSFGLLALSFVALMLIPDKGWSQQGGQSGAHRLYARSKENPATTAFYPRAKENPAVVSATRTRRAIEPLGPVGPTCSPPVSFVGQSMVPALKTLKLTRRRP